ncbi:melanocortin receptor 5-like [Montipora foliosa]|uniref:melanocortin receptor 5-like n=1 Tax=Montipora foliosa TaxID=591990 RepID=UPI0035F12972
MKPDFTETGNCTTIQEFCCLASVKEPLPTVISALNILLSITALMGNVLIFVALRKVSSLHPPSKLLFGCLASTDFCVGLISHPSFVTFIFAREHSKLCYYSTILSNTIGFIFCGVSVLTITAISVDRLLALMLRLRYRQVVTLRRVWVLVVCFWLFSYSFSITMHYKRRIAETITSIIMLLCLVTSIFCYIKIYLTLHRHKAQVKSNKSQGQPHEARIPLNIARYRKTVSSALWVQMTLLACYLPFAVVTGLRGVLGLHSTIFHRAHVVTITLLLLNSTLNPFLYCWKIKEVRRAVKDSINKLNCFPG